jgi:hypothetical protein
VNDQFAVTVNVVECWAEKALATIVAVNEFPPLAPPTPIPPPPPPPHPETKAIDNNATSPSVVANLSRLPRPNNQRKAASEGTIYSGLDALGRLLALEAASVAHCREQYVGYSG